MRDLELCDCNELLLVLKVTSTEDWVKFNDVRSPLLAHPESFLTPRTTSPGLTLGRSRKLSLALRTTSPGLTLGRSRKLSLTPRTTFLGFALGRFL